MKTQKCYILSELASAPATAIVAAVLLCMHPTHAQQPTPDIIGTNKDLVQISTINALIKGVYEGETAIGDLRKMGGFGIGTLNHLDGEMVALDGEVYQVTDAGKVNRVPDTTRTPFACMTNFAADTTTPGLSAGSYKELQHAIDAGLPSENLFYAVKISGTFPVMKVRSVPRQEPPYRVLTEVVKEQALFEFKDTSGTLVGFRCPDYVQGVNVAGYHLHYISDDKTQGGHVLEFELADGTIEVDRLSNFRMMLPKNAEFLETDLSDKDEEAIHKVEKVTGKPAPGN